MCNKVVPVLIELVEGAEGVLDSHKVAAARELLAGVGIILP